MRGRPKILVVGSLVMDLTVCTEKFPHSGETVLGKSFRQAAGGKGANQAVQAARLGADVTMVGKVGNDIFGNCLIESCQSAGIHTDKIMVDPETSSGVGNVLLEVGDHLSAKNRIIVVPGANMTLSPGDISFLQDTVEQYDTVMMQMEIPMEINDLVSRYAWARNVPVMLNPAPSAPLSDSLLSRLAFLSPNEHEAADLTGVPIRREGKQVNLDDVKKAAEVLLAKGVKSVVITLGSAGAAVADQSGFLFQPCIDVVPVRDPTAAGDSFLGAFTVGICAGMNSKQALNFASYTATITVSREGAQPSLPGLRDVLDLMAKQGNPAAPIEAAVNRLNKEV